jgi:hypothetical protein
MHHHYRFVNTHYIDATFGIYRGAKWQNLVYALFVHKHVSKLMLKYYINLGKHSHPFAIGVSFSEYICRRQLVKPPVRALSKLVLDIGSIQVRLGKVSFN